MVFNEYASYYDLLYSDKDYESEAAYINSLLKKYRPDAKSILELGCGTGRHASLLAEQGYHVLGLDQSEEMLERATRRSAVGGRKSDGAAHFQKADIRSFELQEKFDVAVALFHVMSYLPTDEDFATVIKNVHRSLNTQGVFIFDTWYGPAVLMQRPEIRVKHMQNEHVSVTRIAEPVLHENRNICEVQYDIFVRDLTRDIIKEIREVHRMRYYFLTEVKTLLKDNGFALEDAFEFFTGAELSGLTWGSCFAARKK